jgi:hypothetical protein
MGMVSVFGNLPVVTKGGREMFVDKWQKQSRNIKMGLPQINQKQLNIIN